MRKMNKGTRFYINKDIHTTLGHSPLQKCTLNVESITIGHKKGQSTKEKIHGIADQGTLPLSDQPESQGCHHTKQAQVSTFHPSIPRSHQHLLVSEVLLRPYQNEIVTQEQDQVMDKENSS
jgi:hypothetical protein